MKTVTAILNFFGIRTKKQKQATANRSAAQKAAWVKRKTKEVAHDVQ